LGIATASSAKLKKILTGKGYDPDKRWRIVGTDLGIPYVIQNGSVGFLFGDTFNSSFPHGPVVPNDWRSPTGMRSSSDPNGPDGVVFDSAYGVDGDGRAPEVVNICAHSSGGKWPTSEVTCIPNDGIYFPETGRHVISFMSINSWAPPLAYTLCNSRLLG